MDATAGNLFLLEKAAENAPVDVVYYQSGTTEKLGVIITDPAAFMTIDISE